MKVHPSCAGPAEAHCIGLEIKPGTKALLNTLMGVVGRHERENRSIFLLQDRAQVLRIAGGLCTALMAAHSLGVVHLDVKPDNVLLDADLNVCLADWGMAAPLSFTAAQWRARGIMYALEFIHSKHNILSSLSQRDFLTRRYLLVISMYDTILWGASNAILLL